MNAEITSSIEPGASFFSPASLPVILVPAGDADGRFHQRATLVSRHSIFRLQHVKSFWKPESKSPFKHYPWRTGVLQFRFLSEPPRAPSPLGCLHAARSTQAVIGLLSLSDPNALERLDEFENSFSGSAVLVRCFVFDDDDDDDDLENVSKQKQTIKARPGVVVLPPGLERAQLGSQLEIVMHDFAASVLNVLEEKMLTVSPSTVGLESYVDSAAFLGSGLAAVVFSTEDEASRTKRKYGRVQKAMGDYALLAGSPMDAVDHYSTALELARASTDWIYVAAALEGIITSKLMHEATTRDAFPHMKDSVFLQSGGGGGGGESRGGVGRDHAAADDDEGDDAMSRFWETLRGCDALLEELPELLNECKAAIRKRSALPMLVESELRYARLIAGLKGAAGRRKVYKLVGSVQRAAEILPLPEDRLVAMIEAADVLGSVGAARKRALLLWQAVELSKHFGFPEEKTLAVARRALEHPGDEIACMHDDKDGEWAVFRKPLSHAPDAWWGLVKAGILEATLGLAIYANRHADVWDAAAALLREHSALLSPHRIRSLYDNLKAASSNMSSADKMRPGLGPPPVVYLVGPEPLGGEHAILVLDRDGGFGASGGGGVGTADRKSSTPFLYDAFASKRNDKINQRDDSATESKLAQTTTERWVRGEQGRIDLDLYNESPVTMKIARLVLEATVDGVPATKAQWKPKVVSLTVPPTSRPVRITLEATPMVEGEFVLTGCRMTSSEGVSWKAPWSTRPAEPLQHLNEDLRRVPRAAGRDALRALPPLPMAKLEIRRSKNLGADAAGQRTDDAADDAADGDGEKREDVERGTRAPLEMLRGHNAECVLTLSNVGTVDIERASVRVSRRPATTSKSDNSNPSKALGGRVEVRVVTDLDTLMPLAPGAEVDISVAFHMDRCPLALGSEGAGSLNAANASGGSLAVTVPYDVAVEYTGAQHSVDAGNGASTGMTQTTTALGRRARCPLNVSVMPSIELADVSAMIAYGPKRCLLLAGVVNRSSEPLTTACCLVRGEGDQQDERGEEVVIPPGQLRHVALELTSDLSQTSDSVVVRFGRSSEALDGTRALPAEAVRASLPTEVLVMLRPSDISASIRLDDASANGAGDEAAVGGHGSGQSSRGGPRGMRVVLDDRGPTLVPDGGSRVQGHDERDRDRDRDDSMYVVVARVGDTLGVTVDLTSAMNAPAVATYNVHAVPVSLQGVAVAGGGDGGRVGPSAAPTSIVPVVEDEWENLDYDYNPVLSALDLGMAWNGVVQDAVAEVPAKSSVEHRLSLVCWTPGWFKIELSDVRIHETVSEPGSASVSVVTAAGPTNVRVLPAFLRVVER